MKALFATILLAIAAPTLAQEAAEGTPITIGTSHAREYFDGDTREINVVLPPGYDTHPDKHYPVLYLIDGGREQDLYHVSGTAALGALWGRSQPVIVVGIETKDRRAELIGDQGNAEERKQFPTAGNAARFRAFIARSVKPLVEASYRTDGSDAVMGESLAGLFIVDTWLNPPDLFDVYAAINPSLWWHDIALGKAAGGIVKDGRKRGRIFLSTSNEGPMTEQGTRLIANAATPGACYVPRPDLTHATAYHILTPQTLEFLFPTENTFSTEWGFGPGCAPFVVMSK